MHLPCETVLLLVVSAMRTKSWTEAAASYGSTMEQIKVVQSAESAKSLITSLFIPIKAFARQKSDFRHFRTHSIKKHVFMKRGHPFPPDAIVVGARVFKKHGN